jgi:hypothetical protein
VLAVDARAAAGGQLDRAQRREDDEFERADAGRTVDHFEPSEIATSTPTADVSSD